MRKELFSGYVNGMFDCVRKGMAACGRRVKENRATVGYYAVLIGVLVALGTAAYSYRNGSPEAETRRMQISEAAVEAQSVPLIATQEPKDDRKAFVWPLSGKITAEYEADTLQWSETLGMWQTHPAVDVSAESGEAVLAAADGTVIAAYRDALLGFVVEIDHGEGIVFRYCSLSTSGMVEIGKKVRSGDIIASVGTCSAEEERGVHLHLECLVDGCETDCRRILPEK